MLRTDDRIEQLKQAQEVFNRALQTYTNRPTEANLQAVYQAGASRGFSRDGIDMQIRQAQQLKAVAAADEEHHRLMSGRQPSPAQRALAELPAPLAAAYSKPSPDTFAALVTTIRAVDHLQGLAADTQARLMLCELHMATLTGGNHDPIIAAAVKQLSGGWLKRGK